MPLPPARNGSSLRSSRRAFLGLAGAGGALAALARLQPRSAHAAPSGTGPSRHDESAGVPAQSEEPFFSEREREILTQITQRMVASDDPRAPAVRSTGAIDTVDRLCASLDPSVTRPLPALLRLVDWGPFLFELRFQRFTHLDGADQDASLQGWMTSRFSLRRMAFLALRNLAMLGYYTQQETWPLIGYAGPLLQPGKPEA